VRNLIRYWTPVTLWMGFIFWMSTNTFSSEHTALVIAPLLLHIMPSLSTKDIDIIHDAIRKCAHITEYFILGFLLFRAFLRMGTKRKLRQWVVFSFFVVVLYALTDEFHQSFVLSRDPSLRDVAIDTVGGGLALAVTFLFHRLKQRGR
jgi:VanZ family protein